MLRVKHSNVWQVLLRATTIAVFLTCGAFTIALICLNGQTKYLNRPSLIIQASVFIISGLNQILLLKISSRLLIFVSLITQAIALASSLSYINILVKNLPMTAPGEYQLNLIMAHISLLFVSMLFGGTVTTLSFWKSSTSAERTSDLENPPISAKNQPEVAKTVRLKNSAQTLTPDNDLEETVRPQQNWMNNYPTTYCGSDTTSTPSVIKYNLEQQSLQKQTQNQDYNKGIKNKLSFSAKLAKSPKMEALKKMAKGKSSRNNSPEPPSPINDSHVRYVTRLSTIQDNSKSFLNVLNSGQAGDSACKSVNSLSILDNELKSIDSPNNSALLMEKDAIDRINSALLPPSLRISSDTKTPVNISFEQPTLSDIALENPNSDTLLANDLQDIPQIPTWHENEAAQAISTNYVKNTSLEEWQSNSVQLLENERKISSSNSQLLPGFTFRKDVELHSKEDFSFPFTNRKPDLHNMLENENEDAVSELDILLSESSRDHPLKTGKAEFMEDVLKQESTSHIIQQMSKDMTYRIDSHSPTKSITSIMSASANNSMKSPSKLSSLFMNAGSSSSGNHNQHSRSNSQATAIMHSISNANYSTQSSPTKSNKLRRSLSKKISLSNISFKHDENESVISDCFHSVKHARGQSIDFSYVHSLQSKHSPSKSMSTMGRRNSTFNVSERSLRSVSALFFLQHEDENKSQHDCNKTFEAPEIGPTDHEDQSSALSLSSDCSKTQYPKMVFSEYDREKWSTLLNLEKNNIQPENAL